MIGFIFINHTLSFTFKMSFYPMPEYICGMFFGHLIVQLFLANDIIYEGLGRGGG